ncbi:hypothetical protein BSL78_27290, partial [Apostichopus japonicus]
MSKNYSSDLRASQQEINDLHEQAKDERDRAQDLIEAADILLVDANVAVQATAANASTLDAANTKLDSGLANLQAAYNETNAVVDTAVRHADNLTEQADLLEG